MVGEKLNNIWTNFDENEVKAYLASGEVLIFHDKMPAIGPSVDSDLITWKENEVRVKGNLIGNLQYAEIYAADAVSNIALAAQDTWYQITSFNTDGLSNGATPDHTNDHITILETGKYIVSAVIAAHSVTSNDYEYMVKMNNGTDDCANVMTRRTLPVANATGSAMAKGICDLIKDETIELWTKRLDGGAVSKTLIVEHLNLSLIMIGQ